MKNGYSTKDALKQIGSYKIEENIWNAQRIKIKTI